ncbi:nickel-dependent lactate racemase [Desulfosarcina ovata]|uniref:Uncharacterized protein n=1 Tax=Desulfosarcina ovata subsp. ovata TaxID=2752305 RepID=A0A5K8AHY3_9BACT|nr:nickel-dependent lactate racemase [Desulfosarcina ovata]BBO91470.1 hypothetical protein DSCOOX_46500 [Desulfosarcina ovata subsp. ovata]
MTTIKIPYGGRSLQFNLPDRCLGTVLSPQSVRSRHNAGDIISKALAQPVGTRPLKQMVSPGGTVAVIIDDISRCTPTHRMLPLLLGELHDAGIEEKNIRIVIALGTHRPMTPDEILAKTGPRIVDRYRIVNLSSQETDQQVYVGTSSNGIPAWVNRTVAEADFRIGVGMITPHMDVGYSGGAKIILPGVCGQRTVDAFHCRQAALYGNQLGLVDAPMRQDFERFVAERIGLDFILNAIVDQGGDLFDCVAGDCIMAHRKGVTVARQVFGVPVEKRFSIVISNSYPADRDLWQSVKGLASGELMTRDGGTLILVSHCPEGTRTHPHYADYIGRDLDQLLAQLARGTIEDPVACALAVPICRIRQRVKVALVSAHLSHSDADRMGFPWYSDVEGALADALDGHCDKTVAVLTHGGISLPLVRSGGLE